LLLPGAEKREVAMRTHALLSVLALSAVLAAPPLAGAADRHPSSRGGHGDYRSSHGRGDSRSYRAAPRGHYAPSRRPAPRYRYAPRPRYRYDRPGYAYRPYYATPYYPAPYYSAPYYPAPGYYRTYPPVYAAPYPGHPYGYAPYRGGVHGGVSLGFPGFGFSLYF
jgi:hypothetical protein